MSNKNHKDRGMRLDAPVIDESATEFEEEWVKEEESVENAEETNETLSGVVANRFKLNVRREPSLGSDVVGCVDCGTELTVCLKDSAGEWLHVHNDDGIEGYCMKEFVSLEQ